jgi:hypothetical protein
MIKRLLKSIVVIALSLTSAAAYCQIDTASRIHQKPKPAAKADSASASSFKFGVSYMSNNVYMGRTDTVTTPVIVPDIKYTFKNGIYFTGDLFFIPTKPKQKLDGGSVAGGYDWDISDALSAGGSFTKMFYSATSTQIASAISATINANINYDNDYLSPELNIDYNLNDGGINNDFLISPALTHDFIVVGVFGDADIFLIAPTVTLNAGTQNFYDSYLNKKKLRSRKLTAVQTKLLNQYVAQLGQFGILDYELSAPLEYKAGHFIFTFTPTYAIVENQLPKAIAAQLSNASGVFYVEAGVALKF